MRRIAAGCAALVLSLTLASRVAAQAVAPEDDPAARAARRAEAADDPSFGPMVRIERIEIRGNSRTAEKLIRRALLVEEGLSLRSGDPRLRASRFRLLALGFFSDVSLELTRGSRRGDVVLRVQVIERGTITLNRVYLGASEAVPGWAGLDLSDSNLAGTGVGVGAAFVWAAAADVPGGEQQLATQLRLFDPSILGSRLGVHGWLAYRDVSEPVPSGPGGDVLATLPYTRAGGAAGVSWDLTRRARLVFDARYERIDAPAAAAPAVALLEGAHPLVTLAAGFELDTRTDPVLTTSGRRVRLGVEHGAGWMGSDYPMTKIAGKVEAWFDLRRGRRVSLHLAGGWLHGDDAAHFERFYVGDWNRLLTPRPLDLVVTGRTRRDLLGWSDRAPAYGDLAGAFDVEYAQELFRGGRKRVHGGDLFVSVGLAGLGDVAGTEAYVVDLTFDLGFRLDTEIGVFELSLANTLGRLPL